GMPVERSSITLWRLVPEPQRLENEDPTRARFFWRDATTGKVWEPIGSVSTGDRWERDDLGPGTYPATAHLRHHEATPVGISEAVTLDGSRKNTIVTVRLNAGPTLAFRLFDVGSNRPVPGVRVNLVREDSDPVLPTNWTWTSPASG